MPQAITYQNERLAFASVAENFVGVDVGGTGIKGGIVDLNRGELISDRVRVDTPQPATPAAVVSVVADVVGQLDRGGPIGVGFPAVVVKGQVSTANNIDDGWIGENVEHLLSDAVGREFHALNDADAAALAEARYGAARGMDGKVLVLTFGTGIGSGLIVDGELMPNLELGQIEFEGVVPAEREFSAKAREDMGLEWEDWGPNAARYIAHVKAVINPDLVVLGGGAAKRWDKFADSFPDGLGVVPAELANNAGIVGAALHAASFA